MLFEDNSIRGQLMGIVGRLGDGCIGPDDLLQEAIVHLWILEQQYPGQTRSWYLQGCRFHVINCLGAGRSLDAPKRSGRGGSLPISEDGPAEIESAWASAAFGELCARDILAALQERLTFSQRAVLTLLAQGMGLREIARTLGISHPAVIKRRQTIAKRAMQLGLH